MHMRREREKARAWVLELKTINLTLEKFPHSHKEQIVWIPFFSIIIIIIIVDVIVVDALALCVWHTRSSGVAFILTSVLLCAIVV